MPGAVFKTVEPHGKHGVGGFDSHALPPFISGPFISGQWQAFTARIFPVAENGSFQLNPTGNENSHSAFPLPHLYFIALAISLFASFGFRWHSSRAVSIRGATIVASDSITNIGVFSVNLSQVIFSLGVAPE